MLDAMGRIDSIRAVVRVKAGWLVGFDGTFQGYTQLIIDEKHKLNPKEFMEKEVKV